MTKISKESSSIEGGNRSWFIATGDFSSLEARLAAIDTCLNTQGLDPVLYEVYRDGSKTSDLHSMTGFNTFVKGRTAYEIHDSESGKDYVVDELSKFKVLRNGKETVVQAKELLETDSIVEYLPK